MSFLSKIGKLFGSKQPKSRGYAAVSAIGGQNSDWVLQNISDDADLWQNAYALTARVRDLFKTNPIYIKYRENLWANVFGAEGHMLRMKVKENEDRIVHAPDEKTALFLHEERINRIRNWAAKKTGNSIEQYRAYKLADVLDIHRDHDRLLRGTASVLVGALDVYANQTIERAFKEWNRARYCDVRRKRSYNSIRQLRLIGGVRDGDIFLRHVRDTKVNRFGYALQMIPAEWVDRFLNRTLPNGNVIIMGIEYEAAPWGLGAPVAYYLIKRQPNDWQSNVFNMFAPYNEGLHQRIDASEIIHYARPVDADATRPAPWVCATIPKARQLDQYELAEVCAARAGACKTGWLYSDVHPEGGFAGTEQVPDPQEAANRIMGVEPGGLYGLPYGVKIQETDPKHPNGNFKQFRAGMGQAISAGLPGADYNVLFNDLENINFSAGRLGRLDTNEMSMNIQRFDIDIAEIPIFEAWLEMALITGAIPLPLRKFEKFNRPVFQGRRWKQVDEVKDVTAAALRVANNLSSLNRECADNSLDFEEVAIERAEELMFLEELGVPSLLTVQTPTPEPEDDEKLDGKPSRVLNGTTHLV